LYFIRQSIAAVVVFVFTFFIWIPGHSKASILQILKEKRDEEVIKTQQELQQALIKTNQDLTKPRKQSKNHVAIKNDPDSDLTSI